MKKTVLTIVLFALLATSVFAQEVEKICVLNEINYIEYHSNLGNFPQGMYLDEVNSLMVTQDPGQNEIVTINLTNKKITKEAKSFPVERAPLILKFGNDYW